MKQVYAGISLVLLILIIGGVAYYFGTKSTNPNQVVPTPTAPVQNSLATPILTPTSGPGKVVNGGGALTFSAYSLVTPDDWTSQREQGQNSDKVTLTKGGYTISIYEAAFGGGGCLYPGDPPFDMAQTFTNFVEIQNTNGFVFRRGETSLNGKTAWSVCQKNTSDGSFGSPTQFGAISITEPAVSNASVLAEVDAILASLKK